MKIVQIMASKGDGGLEKHFIELCNGLSSKGHEVYALALPKYRKGMSKDVHFIEMNLTKSRRNIFTILKLYKVLKEIQPDIVHAQANKAGLLLAPLLKKITAKSVITIHNIKKKLGFTTRFDLAIGVSKGVVEHFPAAANQKVVYNGIHPPAIKNQTNLPLPDNLTRNTLTALSIGRLVPAKGFDILIEACKEIDCNVLIAGEGPEREKLTELIKSHQLQHRVFLLAHRNDIPDLINFSDLVLISSRKEGFSYAFSEALLLQTPVLSTDVPIPNEVLPEAYISAINEQDLADKIQQAIHHRDSWQDTFAPIFSYARDHLTFKQQLANTITEYEKLLTT